MKILLKSFLTLLLLLGIVFGNPNYLSQNQSSNKKLPLIDPSAKVFTPTDTIVKPIIPIIEPLPAISDTANLGEVLRVIYKNKPGVFLTNEQELITLAKFQWKEIYKLQAQEFKYENYKLQLDLKDAYRERDRCKIELDESRETQIIMSKSYENNKSLLANKTKENAVNESLKLQYKKESRAYKITTLILLGTTTYLFIKQ